MKESTIERIDRECRELAMEAEKSFVKAIRELAAGAASDKDMVRKVTTFCDRNLYQDEHSLEDGNLRYLCACIFDDASYNEDCVRVAIEVFMQMTSETPDEFWFLETHKAL